MSSFLKLPIFAMAFRPFYLLAALYGAIAILLWGFGYTGTTALPVQFWHAHEMIWGYAGAIIVGFLLTASATWTQQPPVREGNLFLLIALWFIARISIFFNVGINISHITGTLFFWVAAALMAKAVIKSHNHRNYIAVIALFLFGLSHSIFHWHLQPFQALALQHGLIAGLIIISGFIGLICNRIIPFFTAKRLNTVAVSTPMPIMLLSLILPLIAALCLLMQTALALSAIFNIIAGTLGLLQSIRWFNKGILREPMLWVLHIGHAIAALGLFILGLSYFYLQLHNLGIHLIAIGGIGLLVIGMMTRTAAGHTGRAIYPTPHGLKTAFILMIFAAISRTIAALTTHPIAYQHSLRLSAVLFALSLLIYAYRYAPWLIQPRADGKIG